MATKSQLKAEFILIKSKLFSFTKKQKLADEQAIRQLYCTSAFEEDILIELKRWLEIDRALLVIIAISETISHIQNIFN